MDNVDALQSGFLESHALPKTYFDREDGRRGRMAKKPIKGIKIPGTDRMLRESVAVSTGALLIAAGATAGVVEAGFIGNQAQNTSQASKIEMKAPMPSQNLPIVDNRVSEVAGVQEKPVNPPGSSLSEAEKNTIRQEQYEPHPNAADRITEQDIQDVLKIVPEKYMEDAKVAIPLLAQALKERNIDTKAVFAYLLATVEHESMFQAMEEIDGEAQALKYNYPGGIKYYGRGYLMTTGEPNYIETGEDIGVDLDANPDLLLNPRIAAQAAVSHLIKHNTVQYAQKLDFVHARKTINGGEFDASDEPFKSTPWKVANRGFDYLEVQN